MMIRPKFFKDQLWFIWAIFLELVIMTLALITFWVANLILASILILSISFLLLLVCGSVFILNITTRVAISNTQLMIKNILTSTSIPFSAITSVRLDGRGWPVIHYRDEKSNKICTKRLPVWTATTAQIMPFIQRRTTGFAYNRESLIRSSRQVSKSRWFILMIVGLVIIAQLIGLTVISLQAAGYKMPWDGWLPSTAKVAPTPTLPNKIAEFSDDFSLKSSGWRVGADGSGRMGYQDTGSYSILVNQPNITWMSPAPLKSPGSLRSIEVDVKAVVEQGTGEYGVLCRYRNSENYYAISINNDSYSISKVVAGIRTFLTKPNWKPGLVIKPNIPNQMKVYCIVDSIRLEVNSTPLEMVQDSGLQFGGIVLYASTSVETGPTGFKVVFDDFKAVQFGP